MSSLAPTYAEARADLLARPGIPGPGRRQALAEAADAWLVEVFEAAGGPGAGASLVAVGGYGRSELSPGSDLDLLLIVRSSASAEAGLAERIWYPLWDSGVRVDHAVRTAGEARLVAAEDLRALLGLLDARCVAGDPEPVQRVVSSVLADWRAAARRRLPDLLADCRQRHERAGHLAYALEPDLKEGRGGLRDLAVLRAIGASWVADAPHAGLPESRRLLLDVRDALHMSGGRGSDRLVQQEHAHVAEAMGLADGDALLAAVGEAARTVTYAFDTVAARVERAVSGGSRRTFLAGPLRRGPKRLPVRAPLADGVVEQDGEVVLARDARPALDASLGLRAAAAAAQAGLRLAPHTVERLAAEGADLPVPWPRDAREALVSLLGAGAATVPVWEALDLAGLVSRWIPEWSAVRYRQQHNPIHRFTVDRHLVEAAAHASTLTRRVARPDLLLVGALLHDIGKGFPGDHTEAGMVVVADLAPRLGFDAADTATLVAMIRLHLLLPETATRRDLDDPATLSAVAAEVGTRELLDLLHALAQADALATGPAAWTEWRAALIDDLAERTRQTLAGDPAPPPPALDGADLPEPGPDGLAVAWTRDLVRPSTARLGAGPGRPAGRRRRRAQPAAARRALGAGGQRRRPRGAGVGRDAGVRRPPCGGPRPGRPAAHPRRDPRPRRAAGRPRGRLRASAGRRDRAAQGRARPGGLVGGDGDGGTRPRPAGTAAHGGGRPRRRGGGRLGGRRRDAGLGRGRRVLPRPGRRPARCRHG